MTQPKTVTTNLTVNHLVESRNKMIGAKCAYNKTGDINAVMGLEEDIAETTRLIELAITTVAKS